MNRGGIGGSWEGTGGGSVAVVDAESLVDAISLAISALSLDSARPGMMAASRPSILSLLLRQS